MSLGLVHVRKRYSWLAVQDAVTARWWLDAFLGWSPSWGFRLAWRLFLGGFFCFLSVAWVCCAQDEVMMMKMDDVLAGW
jgi:hypothetical protein